MARAYRGALAAALALMLVAVAGTGAAADSTHREPQGLSACALSPAPSPSPEAASETSECPAATHGDARPPSCGEHHLGDDANASRPPDGTCGAAASDNAEPSSDSGSGGGSGSSIRTTTEYLKDRYIIRFNEYRMVGEHKAVLEAGAYTRPLLTST
jgi:hypothetical protein